LSPVANDPLGPFWSLPPGLVGLIAFFACPLAIWVIELVRSRFDRTKPPYGLAILRWPEVWLGDTLLAICLGFLAAYYQSAEVDPSIFTGRGFFIFCFAAGVAGSLGFLAWEKLSGGYPKGHQINFNRFYHFFYMAWMIAALVSGSRALFFDPGMEVVQVAFAFALGYFISVAIDIFGCNFPWKWVQRRYGAARTTIP